MAYGKFLITNLWATGTVTASTEAAGLPAINSQDTSRMKAWRSNSSATGQSLLCDMGSSKACDFVAIANLVRQNGEAVKLYEGGTGGSPGAYNLVATLPTQSDDTRLTSVLFNTVSARHWKIEWTNTGAAAIAEAGYVGLGTALSIGAFCEPTVNYDRVDPSIELSSSDGQKDYTAKTGYYTGLFNLDFMLEADVTLFHSAWRSVKRQVPFFLALDTDVLNKQWLARITSSLGFEERGGSIRIYRVSFTWEEAR